MSKISNDPLITINKLTKEGYGQGIWTRQDGKSFLVDVPFSFPNDEVKVKLFKKKKGLYQSKPLEWVSLSDQRVQPRCKHFGSCGGCRWQHVSYPDQLKIKESWIKDYLHPFSNINTEWHPILSCNPPWHYRNKMELSFSQDKENNHYLGLIMQGTRGHVFQMEECHLMPPWCIEALNAVSKWWKNSRLEAYKIGKNTGALRTLTLRYGERTGDRMVILTVSGNSDYALSGKEIQDFVSALRNSIEPSTVDQKLSIFLRIQQIAKGQQTQFFEMLLYGPDHIREIMNIETSENERQVLNFRISPAAFFQPNTRQAERLYSRAIQMSNINDNDIVYDLYCGTGTLGLCVAKQAKQVIGIELSPESVLDAKENIKNNQFSNITIYAGDVGQLLPSLLQKNERMPDLVLVDPPRSGLDLRALKSLLALKTPKITYLSCNPITQAANLEILTKEGYQLKAVQPVDQFPHTIHVENIAILQRDLQT